jgi:hypothetical protein
MNSPAEAPALKSVFNVGGPDALVTDYPDLMPKLGQLGQRLVYGFTKSR